MKNFLPRFALLIFILACAAGVARAQQYPPLDVADDLSATGKLSTQRGAPIMLVFTRPECPFCTRCASTSLGACL